ncbi:hypothetical protein [Flavobacterium sp. UMI-01]|uniref:hypothetical protein n=1 Tax=Flavobacterium sp. UMI-01 TaxID=1441053 RepID=UPI001C7DD8E4|nr:hypothetical protein [Flavobacterium sp. UMI-01]GIZ08348.1 hypothetical protein FUMI01_10750 [Flavobacterium sp. UMI-01]
MDNKIQIQQKQPTSLALTELSRPTLAILNEDYPKVKTIDSKQEINGLLNFLITILNIKVSSEEEKLQLDKQMILIFDLIKTKFGSLTVPEIKEAFKMFVAGEFPNLKVFRMLDCLVVADVLNAFKEFRNDSLRVYDFKKQKLLIQQNTMSEEEINQNHQELLKIVFDDLKATGLSLDAWLLYDKLEANGLINISKAQKKELYAQQAQIYVVELLNETTKKHFHSAKIIIEDARSKIAKGKIIGSVANKCKSIVASNFLKEYLTDFEEFKKQIE